MEPTSHKRAQFKRLSARRLGQAQDMLRLIGNLSSHAYEWEPEEVTDLFDGVRQAVDAAEARFHRAKQWPDGNPAKMFALN